MWKVWVNKMSKLVELNQMLKRLGAKLHGKWQGAPNPIFRGSGLKENVKSAENQTLKRARLNQVQKVRVGKLKLKVCEWRGWGGAKSHVKWGPTKLESKSVDGGDKTGL